MQLRLIADLIYIALDAIWSNKLRSFLTILGNLVAVASIITLVSLIQGVNDEVKNAILSEVGADAFMIARRGVITSEEEMERTRNNPRITLADAEAVKQFTTNVTGGSGSKWRSHLPRPHS